MSTYLYNDPVTRALRWVSLRLWQPVKRALTGWLT